MPRGSGRKPNVQLQETFIQNYLACGGSITRACAKTINPQGIPVNRRTISKWNKKADFRKRLNEAKLNWTEDLRAVALREATGAPKEVKYKEDGETIDKVVSRHRPVPVLLIFMLKALEPETYDDAYRLQLLKQEGSTRLFTKYPLPEVTLTAEKPPERIPQAEIDLPPQYTNPPPRNRMNTLDPFAYAEEEEDA